MQADSAIHPQATGIAVPSDAPQILVPEKTAAARGLGEAQQVSLTTSPRMRLFAFFINLVVVCEVFVAMYFAAQQPDRLTPVFFKIFFALLVPTLVGAYFGRRLIAKAER